MAQFNEPLFNEPLFNDTSTGTSCPTMYFKPTRVALLGACRRTLLDPSSRWWTDTELNDYLNDWQIELQNEFEMVWGTATVTTSTATLTLTDIATDMHRLDAIYWNGR